jgi:hypothetical protein
MTAVLQQPEGKREFNETLEDRARQDRVRDLCCEKIRATVLDVDRLAFFHCDWAFFKNNRLYRWGEYKNRSPAKWGDYKTFMLSLGKWMHLKYLAQQTHTPFVIVVEWGCGTIVYGKWPPETAMGYDISFDMADKDYEIQYGGRTDRGQKGDKEPVILIPNSEFKIL